MALHAQSSLAKMSGLKLANHSIENALLTIPDHLGPAARQQLINELAAEIKNSGDNPPCLPQSQIPDLPPKPHLAGFLTIPAEISGPERQQMVDFNNSVAAQGQVIDRHRNNQAAKKSRETRVESLNNAKSMLNDQTAEITWLRLKIRTLGGDPEDWHTVPEQIKMDLVREIKAKVDTQHEKDMELKKKAEAQRRIDRNKMKALARIHGTAVGSPSSAATPATVAMDSASPPSALIQQQETVMGMAEPTAVATGVIAFSQVASPGDHEAARMSIPIHQLVDPGQDQIVSYEQAASLYQQQQPHHQHGEVTGSAFGSMHGLYYPVHPQSAPFEIKFHHAQVE